MRTVPYQQVLWAVARRLGHQPELGLQVEEAAALNESINTWVRQAWESRYWAELMLEAENVVVADRRFDLLAIDGGDPFAIFATRPTQYRRASLEVTDWRVIGDVVELGEDRTSVFVEYRRKFVPYRGPDLDAGASYVDGQSVYNPTTGNYQIRKSGQWEVIPFPEFLEEYVKMKAAAESRLELGDTAQGDRYDARAQRILETTADRDWYGLGNTRGYRSAGAAAARGVR